MESNPGNPAPDLTTLWLMILTVYGTIIAIIGLLLFLLWLVTWFRGRKKQKPSSSSDLWSQALDVLTPNEVRKLRDLHYSDEWFSGEGQKELYRDFNPN